MPHLIHDMVRHMAVESPVARRIGYELDRPSLPDANENSRFRPLGGKWNLSTVSCGDPEMMTVNVQRMVVHRAQVTESNAHFITGLAN